MLGPVALLAGSRQVELGPAKQRAVLAALLADVGQPVTTETLIDRVWDDAAPARVRTGLYSYITHLRRALAGAAGDIPVSLSYRLGGYLLDLPRDRVDLYQFRDLLEAARTQPDDRQRADLLRTALALWQGEALADLSGAWIERQRSALEQLRVDALLQWATVALRLHQPEPVIGPLRAALERHPLIEPLAARLVEALHAAGRAAEALDTYGKTRQRLVDELGTEPGPQLRRLHTALLRGELAAAPGPGPSGVSGPVGVRPAQLPPDIPGFTGREAHLKELDALLPGLTDAGLTAVVISAIAGTAGIGKTTLAVHWAHQVRDRFPDGQLYVNLRGFDPDGAVLPPTEAMRRLLDALGVPAQRVPTDLATQTGLYRSLLDGKRMLVLLDNARDAEQVRPLLPGAPGCLVVVTSRNRLSSLVAAEGARPLALDVLSTVESHELLTRRLGGDRVAAEPAGVADIIEHCARLPLALAVAAARAVTDPGLSLTDLADQLQAATGRLDAFDADDPVVDVRSVFSWSYDALSEPAARLFRRLGLHPGPDISAAATASLAGVAPGETRALLGELTKAHLLAEHVPGRYACHDLLRAYATELAQRVDSATERHQATLRILDHYLHSACDAALALEPHRDAFSLSAARPGVTAESFADRGAALAWFAAERSVLLAAVVRASTTHPAYAWQLTWALSVFLDRQGHWPDWMAVQLIALAAAQRLDDRAAQVRGHRGLAGAYTRLGRYDDAYAHYERALELSDRGQDWRASAVTHLNVALLLERQGRDRESIVHTRQALELNRAIGNATGEARALNNIGWLSVKVGQYEQSIGYCQQALAIHREVGNRYGEGSTLDSLGYAQHHLGRYADAAGNFRAAVQIFQEVGDRYHEAAALTHLGDTQRAAGDPDAASLSWRTALSILDELGHADAADLRARLAASVH